jgi:predicted DNA-binding transcriptional regulator AlpA
LTGKFSAGFIENLGRFDARIYIDGTLVHLGPVPVLTADPKINLRNLKVFEKFWGRLACICIQRARPVRSGPVAPDTAGVSRSFEMPLMTIKQVAEVTSLSPKTLTRLRAAGQLVEPIKIGRAVRWDARHIEAWIDNGCRPLSAGYC